MLNEGTSSSDFVIKNVWQQYIYKPSQIHFENGAKGMGIGSALPMQKESITPPRTLLLRFLKIIVQNF